MSLAHSITKDGLNSYTDFGVWIKSSVIHPAKKNKIYVTIPYMNGAYDVSTLYGEQSYAERELEYVFEFDCKDKASCERKKQKLISWLTNGEKTLIQDSTVVDYIFNAECVDISVSCDKFLYTVTAKFNAYPYLLGKNLEGLDIWDDFEFDVDDTVYTKFNWTDCYGSEEIQKEFMVYNRSDHNIVPKITYLNLKDDITINGEDFDLQNISKTIVLVPGENHFVVTIKWFSSNASINLEFRREVL